MVAQRKRTTKLSVLKSDGKLALPKDMAELRYMFDSIKSVASGDTRFMAQAAMFNSQRLGQIETLMAAQVMALEKFTTIASLLAERLSQKPSAQAAFAGFDVAKRLGEHTDAIAEMVGAPRRSVRRNRKVATTLGSLVDSWGDYQRALDPEGFDKAKAEHDAKASS